MADTDSLEALQGLHRDLLALSESRLPNIDRLFAELLARVDEFKKLLDKPRKNDRSREALRNDTLEFDGEKYQVNDEFKQDVVRAADFIDLDEIEAAKLCLAAQDDAVELDRSLYAAAIIRFHKRRQFLLESLRLVLKQSHDPEGNEEFATLFGEYVRKVLGIDEQMRLENGHAYWQKCLASMGDIERWLQGLADLMLAGNMVGKPAEEMEMIDFQRTSLTRQHESLAAICTHLIKAGYTSIDNFRGLISTLKTLSKHDLVLVHYVPIVTSSISQLVSSERSSSLEDARALHKVVIAGKEGDGWKLRNFHSAVIVWWLVEYSSRYVDPAPLNGVDLDVEAEERTQLFLDSMRDGAFHFMLSVSQDVRPNRWYDPAKARLLSFVLQDAPSLPADSTPISDFFQVVFTEQMQLFVDAFITNMPDTLRKLKVEEDDKRRMIHSRFQPGPVEQELHLERFFLIISYAFAESPDAAQNFWSDTDGNLYGFLQWAAKRQTTPRAAAFCEMLKSLTEGEDCAAAAHRFLQEEGVVASGKLRRTTSLSYQHILSELHFYATSIKEKPNPSPTMRYQRSAQDSDDYLVEPETGLMLECHLRLLTHLCRESSEARSWILNNPNFPVVDMLLQLSTIPMESRLRANVFSVLSSLLVAKTAAVGDSIWTQLDSWITHNSVPHAITSRTTNSISAEKILFDTVATDYDEATAFMSLLTALVAPYADDTGLHDTLPFPETLGSSYRMPGIDKYVDFALERVFGQLCKKVEDPLQLRVLRWHCLNFISVCLSTFNEDLVVFANSSNLPVDTAMHSSSLLAYVQLHPFARVMEWLFNDNVISSLFAAAHQDVAEVNDSTPDSPLLLSLVKSIEVLDLVMTLQNTFLDVERGGHRSKNATQKRKVANTALASFEDAVLNHLYVVVDLGLYCGTGQQDLTLCSIHLLEKLTSSRKLVVSPMAGFGQRSDRSKVIGIMEKDNDSERIAKALTSEMGLDQREFEQGPEAPGYLIKMGILDFLNSCLEAIPNRPTVAHLLLGFSCGVSTLDIPEDGLFVTGHSLFHSVLRLAVEYPEMISESFTPWSSGIKQKCINILMKLWRSPLSSAFVMTELRASEYFQSQMLRQHLVDNNTLFSGSNITDPDFIFNPSAIALEKFLQQRTAFFEYTARELRLVGGLPTLRARMQTTLLGVTVLPDGEQMGNPSVFDLFDFMELEVVDDYGLPELPLLGSMDFKVCLSSAGQKYDMRHVAELITIRSNELRKAGRILSAVEEQQMYADGQLVLGYLVGVNQRKDIARARGEVLKAWTQLMMVLLEKGEFDDSTKTSFILQALQVILPKLEKAYVEDVSPAIDLADLARRLLANVNFKSKSIEEKGRTSDLAKDRLLQLFRVALSGIFCLVSNAELREICYQICYRYLRGTSDHAGKPASAGGFGRSFSATATLNASALVKSSQQPSTLTSQTMRTVRSAGSKMIDVVCDDSYAGQGTCRISALLFLDALVALSAREDDRYIIDSLVRLNFIDVLVDSIKLIPTELRNTGAGDIPLLLSFIDAYLALLLRISQTRAGAAQVLNAGLFSSVRESQIFSTDPDFGFEIDNPHALRKFFDLMLAVLRVVNAVVVVRGPQNAQCRAQARDFVADNRASVVAVFKRAARTGTGEQATGAELEELVDNLCLLMTAVGFLEYEDQQSQRPGMLASFS
ncbi:nuclear pore complex subunit nup192 [Diplodia corticola]|uniref:Nuclear pore complex subunit nup192 n=1 Tax=Diplodia corticola TaxID=236234 RepID=A0A1J9QTA0_9PEZI|nr:nuclear pore complex subunit nup192 [Diplodia corticola]OJD31210.1 nuclear pore complex subunit nup192 [Diplodia corticola]